jgi:hypothetical protein
VAYLTLFATVSSQFATRTLELAIADVFRAVVTNFANHHHLSLVKLKKAYHGTYKDGEKIALYLIVFQLS